MSEGIENLGRMSEGSKAQPGAGEELICMTEENENLRRMSEGSKTKPKRPEAKPNARGSSL